MKIRLFYIFILIIVSIFTFSCLEKLEKKSLEHKDKPTNSRDLYIRAIAGVDEPVDSANIERGKVLLSYSDCYTCHREDKKVLGPSFQDINLRYPRQQVFIRILAQRVIYGGSGAWGQVEMKAHPKVSTEDAKDMVTYILSSNK